MRIWIKFMTFLSFSTIAFGAVADSADKVSPLLIGAHVPDVNLTTIEGQSINLPHIVSQKPTVVIFYRGGWCPFCNRQLAGLQDIQQEIVNAGWQIIAISPDKPEKLVESRQKHGLQYRQFSDSPMTAAQAFGIAFKVDKETLQRYKGWGIDLEAASGQTHHWLPVPSVFLIGTDGRIRFTYVNPDYKVRIRPSVLIAAIKAENGD